MSVLERIGWRAHEMQSKIKLLYERARSQVGSLPEANLSENEQDAAVQREVRRRKHKEQ